MSASARAESKPGWVLKGLILMLSLPVALSFAPVGPILPEMSAALAHNATDAYLVKMVSGIIGAAMVVGAPIAGILADKVARGPLLAGSALVFAVAGVAPFLLENLPMILLTRFLVGLAAITMQIVGIALVGDNFDGVERPRWMGMVSATSMLSGVVALPISGLLGDQGWHFPFLLYFVGVPIAAVAWFGLRSSAAKARAAPSHDASTLDSADTSRFPLGLALLALLVGVIAFVPSIYIPFHLRSLGAENPSSLGFILTTNVIVAAAVATQFGRARRFMSSTTAFGFSFACIALGLGIIALAPSYHVAIVGLLLMGLGLGWLGPNLMATAVGSVDERRRGRTVGIVRSAHSLAPALGVTALEPLVRSVGIQGVLLLIVALATAMFAGTAAVRLRRRWPPRAAASHTG